MAIFTAFRRYWYAALLAVILTTTLAVGVTLLQPQRYDARVTVLVIQQQKGRFDAYTAARSAQTVAETLVNVLHTSTFQEAAVRDPAYKVDDTFPKDPEARRKAWKKAVQARTANDDGTIVIDVLHEDRNQARAIAYAIAGTLISKGQEYHGGGQDVVIKMIDEPVTSVNVADPNLTANVAAGMGLGVLIGIGVLILLEGRAGSLLTMQAVQLQEQKTTMSFEGLAAVSSANDAISATIRPEPPKGGWVVDVMPHVSEEVAHEAVEAAPVADVTEEVNEEANQGEKVLEAAQEIPEDDAALPEIPAGEDETEEDEQETKVSGNANNLQEREGDKQSAPEQIGSFVMPAIVPASESPSTEMASERITMEQVRNDRAEEKAPVTSFKGGLEELRAQMRDRREQRERQIGEIAERAPFAPKGFADQTETMSPQAASLAARLREKLEEQKAKRAAKQQEAAAKTPEAKIPSDDPQSVENWMRTGTFLKSN